MPEVSVVIPVYNGARFLELSIKSVIDQTLKEWELILVDDCSTDESLDIMNSYAEQDSRIKVIHNIENKKLPESLNIGFRAACGKYLTWTSDDNIYENTALEEMKNYLDQNLETPMVISNMIMINEDGDFLKIPETYSYHKMSINNYVGACFLYRSQIREEVGEYDSNWFLVEDYEYWLRIIDKYGEIAHLDRNLYKYRIHNKSLSTTKVNQIRSQVNHLRNNRINELIKIANGDEELVCRLYSEMLEDGSLTKQSEVALYSASFILKHISKYDANKESVIYGAGVYGKKLSLMIDNVIFFVDKNYNLAGNRINNIEIISIDSICELEKHYQIIIALSVEKLPFAMMTLVNLGIKKFCLMQSICSDG